MYGAIASPTELTLVMEYVERGSIRSVSAEHLGPFSLAHLFGGLHRVFDLSSVNVKIQTVYTVPSESIPTCAFEMFGEAVNAVNADSPRVGLVQWLLKSMPSRS